MAAVSPSLIAYAQWTDDPAVNTPLVTGAGDQVQAKIARDGSGGFYLSWFSSTGGYDVYLQRFDSAGNAQWVSGGLLVADRNFSSTQDYGLAVTDDGAAVLAYRGSGTSITAATTKVSPLGTIEWSIQANGSSGSVDKPEVTVASDGDIVVGWIAGSSTRLQRISPDGAAEWSTPITISDGSNSALIADIQPGGVVGEVIVSMVTYATFSGAKRLKAQKVLADGSYAWSSNRSVFNSGSLQFGAFPSFISDGSGGGLFSWYGVSPLQCHVQRLSADGDAMFGSSGAAVTDTSSGRERTNPVLAFDVSEQLLVVTWVEHVTGSSLYGHSGQRFDPENGSRLWGANGTEIYSPATHYDILGIAAVIVDGEVLVAWNPEVSFNTGEISSNRLDSSGTKVWAEDVPTCTVRTGHFPLLGIRLGMKAVFVWNDDRAGNEDFYGQNLNLNGTLGGSVCPEDLTGDGQVGGDDLGLFLVQWGACSGCSADFTGDGFVNGADLGLLIAAWGVCPP